MSFQKLIIQLRDVAEALFYLHTAIYDKDVIIHGDIKGVRIMFSVSYLQRPYYLVATLGQYPDL